MPLNFMELLYGVIPMAFTMFHILTWKYKLPLFYNEDLFIWGPQILQEVSGLMVNGLDSY
jgi:hypothetical protein